MFWHSLVCLTVWNMIWNNANVCNLWLILIIVVLFPIRVIIPWLQSLKLNLPIFLQKLQKLSTRRYFALWNFKLYVWTNLNIKIVKNCLTSFTLFFFSILFGQSLILPNYFFPNQMQRLESWDIWYSSLQCIIVYHMYWVCGMKYNVSKAIASNLDFFVYNLFQT